MEKYIIKADGKKEPYNKGKISSSIKKAGASPEIAANTTKTINRKIKPNMSTDEIFYNTVEHLKTLEPKVALKYSLKRAIMNMGPEGYVFEKFVAKILKEYGFVTKVSQILKGYCVEHEVDVVATKDNNTRLIECKYHNSPGTKSDIKIALYIHSRFQDIKKALSLKTGGNVSLEAWLVTNTKCTSDAIKYSNCTGLKVLAMHYPRLENLQYLIVTKKLYPVSILSSITERQKERLFNSGIIMVKELSGLGPDKLADLLGTDTGAVSKILDEASTIF